MNQKVLFNSISSAGTDGVLPLWRLGARPERDSATGERFTDGPYEHFAAAGLKRLMVGVTVSGGEADVALQGCNGDPATSAWFTLDSLNASDETVVLNASELSVLWLRLVWAGAIGDPDITAEVLGGH